MGYSSISSGTTYNNYGGLKFDPENRLSGPAYTGDGLLAWIGGSPASKTYRLYDGDELLCELSSTGAVTAVNTFGATGLLSRHTASSDLTYTFDPSGNVSQALSSDATDPAVVTAHISNAYGFNDWQPGGTNPGSISFGGQFGYEGDVNGLLLLTHRLYDQNTGRFLTRDPMGYDGGVNLYAYVQNNPVNKNDPSGFCDCLFPGGLNLAGTSVGVDANLVGGIGFSIAACCENGVPHAYVVKKTCIGIGAEVGAGVSRNITNGKTCHALGGEGWEAGVGPGAQGLTGGNSTNGDNGGESYGGGFGWGFGLPIKIMDCFSQVVGKLY